MGKRIYRILTHLVETGRIRLVLELRFLMAIVSWDEKTKERNREAEG